MQFAQQIIAIKLNLSYYFFIKSYSGNLQTTSKSTETR